MSNCEAFSRNTHFTDKWPYIADTQLIDGQSVIQLIYGQLVIDQSIDRWSNIQTIDGQSVIQLIYEWSDLNNR